MVVRDDLVFVDRETRLNVVHEHLGRRDVDVLDRILIGEAADRARRGRFVRRDHLNDGSEPIGEVCVHLLKHRRHLHRGQNLIEKPLMRSPELSQCRGLQALVALARRAVLAVADADDLVDIPEHALPGFRRDVIHIALIGRQFLRDAIILHPFEADRSREVEPHLLHVPRHDFHRRQAAAFDLRDEILHVVELGALAPQSEPLGIGEIGHFGRAGRGCVDDARVRQPPLQL